MPSFFLHDGINNSFHPIHGGVIYVGPMTQQLGILQAFEFNVNVPTYVAQSMKIENVACVQH